MAWNIIRVVCAATFSKVRASNAELEKKIDALMKDQGYLRDLLEGMAQKLDAKHVYTYDDDSSSDV